MRRLGVERGRHLPVGAARRGDPAPARPARIGITVLRWLVRVPGCEGATLAAVNSRVPVLLSSSSVFPEPTAAAFEMAATLGYDGVEVMVWTDAVSQDAGALRGLVRPLRRAGAVGARALPAGHPAGVEPRPVGAAAPRRRARRDAGRADRGGAPAVHLAARLRPQLRRRPGAGSQARHPDIAFAVENMYPVRMAGREFVPYAPGWDPTETGFDAYTLDLSHCAAVAQRRARHGRRDGRRAGPRAPGRRHRRGPRRAPGARPRQPAVRASCWRRWPAAGSPGSVAVEVATRKAASRAVREADLAESLAFARAPPRTVRRRPPTHAG